MNAWLVVSSTAVFLAVVLSFVALAHGWSRPLPGEPQESPRLPWAWRFSWPFVRRLAPLVASTIGALQRVRLREQLARAGLDAALGVDEFVAGQLLAGCLAGSIAAGLAWGVDIASGWAVVAALAIGALWPRVVLRETISRRRNDILRQLPHDLDIVTLCVEAGLNLGAALGQAARHGPPGPLRAEWQRVLGEVRAGQPRHDALRVMATRVGLPAVSNLVAALIAAERQGASLAPILRAQAEQRRTERFLRAERLAMQAPVKMLFPLVLCIFPGTFAILLFPVVYRLLTEGVL